MRTWLKSHKLLLLSTGALVLSVGCILTAVSLVDNQSATKLPDKPLTADNLFAEINSARSSHGVFAFNRNSSLDESARLKCEDMVANNYYEHVNPSTGKHGYAYIDDVGIKYSTSSENLNAGVFTSAKQVIDSWMASEPHRKSILDAQYTQIGFAICANPKQPNEYLVVQHKISPPKTTTPAKNVSVSNQATPSQPKTHTCDADAKSTQEDVYQQIVASIEQSYQIELQYASDETDRQSAAATKQGKLDNAKFNHNRRLIEIGCF